MNGGLSGLLEAIIEMLLAQAAATRANSRRISRQTLAIASLNRRLLRVEKRLPQ